MNREIVSIEVIVDSLVVHDTWRLPLGKPSPGEPGIAFSFSDFEPLLIPALQGETYPENGKEMCIQFGSRGKVALFEVAEDIDAHQKNSSLAWLMALGMSAGSNPQCQVYASNCIDFSAELARAVSSPSLEDDHYARLSVELCSVRGEKCVMTLNCAFQICPLQNKPVFHPGMTSGFCVDAPDIDVELASLIAPSVLNNSGPVLQGERPKLDPAPISRIHVETPTPEGCETKDAETWFGSSITVSGSSQQGELQKVAPATPPPEADAVPVNVTGYVKNPFPGWLELPTVSEFRILAPPEADAKEDPKNVLAKILMPARGKTENASSSTA